MVETLYWLCLLLPVYAYLGYPLGLALLAWRAPREDPRLPRRRFR